MEENKEGREYADIEQPIIKISEIPQGDIPCAKLSRDQEWTLNNLKTIDKTQGTD